MGAPPDHLEIEAFSPLGETPVLVLDSGEDAARYAQARALVIGVDREGALPALDPTFYDILLTSADKAPKPWLSAPGASFDAKLEALREAARGAPIAASILRQVLRLNEANAPQDGLQIESFAYSTLLGGAEFRRWREANPSDADSPGPGAVSLAREDDLLVITLDQPDTRNAMTAAMRDALFEALAAALDDPSRPRVRLQAAGACFSVGGDLREFGANADLAGAHVVRTMRSVAALLYELGARAEVIFHGACIGSGLEAPAAAARRIARPGAFFQLPEVKFGLIPGAGGTITVPRAIGRHRACAMMLGGARVSAATALEWGLVHAIEPAP